MLINTDPRPSLFQRAAPVLPFFCCLAVFLLTLSMIRVIWMAGPWQMEGQNAGYRASVWIALAFSLSFTYLLDLSSRKRVFPLARALQIFFVILFAGAVANIIWKFTDIIAYGDSRHFTKYLRNNQVFPRWFLGTAIMTRIYEHLWPFVSRHLPGTLSSPDGLIRAAGAFLMGGASVIFLRTHGDRLALLVPLLSPVWLMFCTGYNEYYPFIAFVYIGFLFMLSGRLEARSPVSVAAVSSLLLLSYTAFVPLGLMLIAVYWFTAGLKKGLAALLITVAVCVTAFAILWPETFSAFTSGYRDALNLGEKNTHYAAYIGRAAGDTTPFFRLSYAVSAEHILHLAFMFLFSTGTVPLLLFAAIAVLYLKKRFPAGIERRKGTIFLGALLLFQLCYSVLLIPKLGPIKDIDLFFSVYLTLGFAAGFAGDGFLESITAERRDILKNCIVASCIGSSTVLLAHLLWLGIIPSWK